jgi:hypothetical protein
MTYARTIFLATLCSSATVFAANDSEFWIADQNGCLAANPEPVPNEHVEWSGECVDGYIEGEGILIWYQSGVVTGRDQGRFENGRLSGHGRVESFQGWSYEGEFPGPGVLKLDNGAELPAQTLRHNTGWHIEQVRE